MEVDDFEGDFTPIARLGASPVVKDKSFDEIVFSPTALEDIPEVNFCFSEVVVRIYSSSWFCVP